MKHPFPSFDLVPFFSLVLFHCLSIILCSADVVLNSTPRFFSTFPFVKLLLLFSPVALPGARVNLSFPPFVPDLLSLDIK